MAEPADFVVRMLREIRTRQETAHAELIERFESLEKRFAQMEKRQETFSAALRGDSLMSKLVTGDFEERLESIERRLHELEASK